MNNNKRNKQVIAIDQLLYLAKILLLTLLNIQDMKPQIWMCKHYCSG